MPSEESNRTASPRAILDLPKVLLVDDRPENLFAMKRALRALRAEMHTALSGTEALSKMLEHRYAVVLLDVQMPDMDGFETAELMRGHAETEHVPVIFVTAISKERHYQSRGYQAGAADYLTKPIDPVALVSKVGVFLELDQQRGEAERALRELREVSQRNELILTCAQEGVVGLDAGGVVTFANPAAEAALHLRAPRSMVGRHISDYVGPTDDEGWRRTPIHRALVIGETRVRIESSFISDDGAVVPVEYSVAPFVADDEARAGGVLVFQDISVRKQAEDRLLRMARYDQLTGLANRAYFYEYLRGAIARCERAGRRLALLLIDLDHFKRVNDAAGHGAGDELLESVGERLRAAVRAGDFVARLGGDEFALVLHDAGTEEHAGAVAGKVVEQIGRPHRAGGSAVEIGCSIGVAVYGGALGSVESLLREADVALYEVKRAGRNAFAVYEPSMSLGAARREWLKSHLERAFDEDSLDVHFQPQCTARRAELVGLEATVRWVHPEGEAVPTAELVAIAEESRQIARLGEHVLRVALRQLHEWKAAERVGAWVRVSVDVSAVQLRDREFSRTVARILQETGRPGVDLELEVTETALMPDFEAALGTLKALRALGVRIAIDDFGTGYSSLAYLRRLPIDCLKIDRSFISGLPGDPHELSIVKAVIGLGRELGLEIVADGVETREQARLLARCGCGVLQGGWLAPAAAPRDLEARFAEGFRGDGTVWWLEPPASGDPAHPEAAEREPVRGASAGS